ncbi:hypothetical protein L227DRAFT_153524 [Lentinus tigrinus ALCF2SS1-6]|uniref:Uncharacterized protein n=1 Tax=Lentinus tigrinus ALCF2SS1-6 TaxID=1328759 RepID=A0A5C2SE73_9APHY|nr:hypothetical protein L227DRAFT_153524 [Lentinus tigrinus ALCF2SS1-6]
MSGIQRSTLRAVLSRNSIQASVAPTHRSRDSIHSSPCNPGPPALVLPQVFTPQMRQLGPMLPAHLSPQRLISPPDMRAHPQSILICHDSPPSTATRSQSASAAQRHPWIVAAHHLERAPQ